MQIQSSSFFAENGGVKSWAGAGQGQRRSQQWGGEVEWSSAAGPDVLVAIAFLLTKHTHMRTCTRNCTHIHAHSRTSAFGSFLFCFARFARFLYWHRFLCLILVLFSLLFCLFSAPFFGGGNSRRPLPFNPLPRSGAHNGQRGKGWAAGRMDKWTNAT